MATLKELKEQDLGKTYRKMLPFDYEKAEDKAGDPDVAGEITGAAAGLLNIDKGEDLILPGFFEDTNPEEVIVAYQHDITSILGKPLEFEERLDPDYILHTKSEIVSTSLGNDVMKLVRRKILRKMSIGYRLQKGGYAMLNRDSLVGTLKDFDYKGWAIPDSKQREIIADFDKRELEGVFALTKGITREYSIVTWPMNDRASITEAKDEWGGALESLPFSLHPLIVLAANKRYVERAKSLFTDLRAPEKRGLGASHKEALEFIAEEGAKVAAEARELLQAIAAIKSGDSTTLTEAELILKAETLLAEIDARNSGNIPLGVFN
jgi:HK97 family phage prohead protease